MSTDKIKTIVVVGTQRSGTTWLMQVLSQVPSFVVYGEVFREIYLRDFRGDPSLKPPMFYLDYISDKNNKQSPMAYVDSVLAIESKVTVFKIMYDQIRRNKKLLRLLADPRTLTINLQRADIFELALSKCLARKTGVFHADRGLEIQKFEIEYNKLYSLLLKEKVKELIFPLLIKKYSKHYLHFVYEDLLNNFENFPFLLNQHTTIDTKFIDPSNTKWKKTAKAAKYEAISNFDDINGKLKRSIFKRYAK